MAAVVEQGQQEKSPASKPSDLYYQWDFDHYIIEDLEAGLINLS